MNIVRIRVRSNFNARKIESKVDDATFRSLGHAGGTIRKTAIRSIRRSKRPSRPGTPPHTPTGHLKRVVRYVVDKEREEVAIGPVNSYARTIWSLHEFGGNVRPKPRLLKKHKFTVGEYGPIRRSGAMQRDGGGRFVRRSKKFARVLIKSEAQARRVTRIVDNENAQRIADSKKQRHYPKRPFMGPALEVQRHRLPKLWANSVRA